MSGSPNLIRLEVSISSISPLLFVLSFRHFRVDFAHNGSGFNSETFQQKPWGSSSENRR